MFHNIIQERAVFIADSHYPTHGEEFLDILQKIDKNEIKTSQLFLMGDNFDLLFGYNKYIQAFSTPAVKLLQKLSKKIEIHYLEGNHDFCLKEIFPNIKVYSREEQPVIFQLNDKKVYLAHGDKYDTGFGYDLYCKILRNKFTLKALNPFGKLIIDYRVKKLSQKSICNKFTNFSQKIDKILTHYKEADLIIEGHFHQSKIEKRYLSLPSLACQKMIGVVQDGEIIIL